MTERERLIELLTKGQPPFNPLNDVCTEKLADYLLANGVIVPPCKVGDVVKCDEIYYHIYRMQAYEDYETPIHYRYWAEPITDEGEDDFWFWSDSLGEGTVIVCSKEEAEQALKGGEQG